MYVYGTDLNFNVKIRYPSQVRNSKFPLTLRIRTISCLSFVSKFLLLGRLLVTPSADRGPEETRDEQKLSTSHLHLSVTPGSTGPSDVVAKHLLTGPFQSMVNQGRFVVISRRLWSSPTMSVGDFGLNSWRGSGSPGWEGHPTPLISESL